MGIAKSPDHYLSHVVAYIYRMVVRPGWDEQFIEAWKEVTLAYRSKGGGLGSCLHRAKEQEYIAYARWPAHETRDALNPDSIEGVNAWRQKMRKACSEVEEIYRLDSVEDLLLISPPPDA